MYDKNPQSKKAEATGVSSPLHKLGNEWKIFLFGFFRPLVFIPALLTIISLYVANSEGINKAVSLILQLIAIIFVTIAAGAFYDAIRSVIEVNITQKKGVSAVRNLSLSRVKAKNISSREKEGASPEEIRNLVSLLEKDIANAVQEWNDILPGVAALEEVYNVMAEKESELEAIKKEKAQLEKHSVNQKELGEKEKDELKNKLNSREKRISELENEISKLRIKTDSIPLGISGYSMNELKSNLLGGLTGYSCYGIQQFCSNCGRPYYFPATAAPADNIGLCDSCKAGI